jgi:glycosyltransferase involved in cell wall biosynthesis
MGTRFTFINFCLEPWDSPWLTHQPIMWKFHRDHNILYVLKETEFNSVAQSIQQSGDLSGNIRKINDSIYELQTSPLLPKIYFSTFLDGLSLSLRANAINRFLDKMKWENRILYFWNPHFKDYSGRFKELLSIFHAHDYYPAFEPAGSQARATAERNFQDLVRRADLVFPCSEAIGEMISPVRDKSVHLIENGVDFDRAREVVATGAVAQEMQNIPRPRIGYIGRVGSKVNINLMRRIATQKPEWSMILMGPLVGTRSKYESEMAEFRKLPNAYYLEGCAPEELPRFMNGLDVGLMCYHVEGLWTKFGFPLKMFEYFSVGKPGVCSDLSSVRKYKPMLRIADEEREWVSQIEESLQDNSDEAAKQRMELAEKNSWRRRADNILQLIQQHPKMAGQG